MLIKTFNICWPNANQQILSTRWHYPLIIYLTLDCQTLIFCSQNNLIYCAISSNGFVCSFLQFDVEVQYHMFKSWRWFENRLSFRMFEIRDSLRHKTVRRFTIAWHGQFWRRKRSENIREVPEYAKFKTSFWRFGRSIFFWPNAEMCVFWKKQRMNTRDVRRFVIQNPHRPLASKRVDAGASP